MKVPGVVGWESTDSLLGGEETLQHDLAEGSAKTITIPLNFGELTEGKVDHLRESLVHQGRGGGERKFTSEGSLTHRDGDFCSKKGYQRPNQGSLAGGTEQNS